MVRPDAGARFVAAEQAVAGNVALYGATAGEAYFCGQAGERFAVRNSGACAVVGRCGRPRLRIHDRRHRRRPGTHRLQFRCRHEWRHGLRLRPDEHFQNRCNIESGIWNPSGRKSDQALLRRLVEQHAACTGSAKAASLLANWDAALPLFVKVMPLDYKNVLRRQAKPPTTRRPPPPPKKCSTHEEKTSMRKDRLHQDGRLRQRLRLS